MAFAFFGLFSLAVFYSIVFAVAFWARRFMKNSSEDEMILAGRRLGLITSTMTLTATFVGATVWIGGAEITFSRGLIWNQGPLFFSVGLLTGTLLLLEPIRKAKVVTVLDLFQDQYGVKVGTMYVVITFVKDLVMTCATLNSIGLPLAALLDISPTVSVIFSSIFVGIYTSIGSMFAVVYTDVVQLVFMFLGIAVAIPFVCTHKAVDSSKLTTNIIFGSINLEESAQWIDIGITFTFGIMTSQSYIQRILAVKTTKMAKKACILSAFLIFLMSLPAAILGINARVIDWKSVPSLNRSLLLPEDSGNILPLTLRHLMPESASILALCALTAAAMSSADSSVLGASSYVVRNFYKAIIRDKAGENEIAWALRISNLIIPIVAVIVALISPTVYHFSILASDLSLFLSSHLMITLHWPKEKNAYGAILSMIIGVVLRLLGGVPVLHLPAIILYPGYDPASGNQLFPHRISNMVMVAVSHIVISWSAKMLFKRGILREQYDILKVFFKAAEETRATIAEQPTDQLLTDLRK